MPTPQVNPQYDLTPEQAIERLKEEGEKHAIQPDDPRLVGLTVDQAWVIGYQTAIHDYLSLTGPNPREVGIVYMTAPEGVEEGSE